MCFWILGLCFFSIQSNPSRFLCFYTFRNVHVPSLGAVLFFGPSPNVSVLRPPAFPSLHPYISRVHIFSLPFLLPCTLLPAAILLLTLSSLLFVAYLPACVSILASTHRHNSPFFSPVSLSSPVLPLPFSSSYTLCSHISQILPNTPRSPLVCSSHPCALVHYRTCSSRERGAGYIIPAR